MLSEVLPARLRQKMEEKKLSQTSLAQKAGLSTSFVSDLVLGRRGNRLSIATVQKLKGALGVGDDFFLPDRSAATDISAQIEKGRIESAEI